MTVTQVAGLCRVLCMFCAQTEPIIFWILLTGIVGTHRNSAVVATIVDQEKEVAEL